MFFLFGFEFRKLKTGKPKNKHIVFHYDIVYILG